MLRDLEIKYYGDEERHPYSQEQFNDAIMSGNFMRVRKAMVNNVLTAPRLAMWTNPYGANLLHLLCRSTKCDGQHAGDDIATVLCNIAPSLLSGRDNMGRIPLHDAVDRGQVCRVIRLLTFHSPVNAVDRNGNTPLSLAYLKNHAKMVKILLQAGAAFHSLESAERRSLTQLGRFQTTWQTRCWGGLRLAQAPMHNGRPLEPTSIVERGDHMIFYISPVNGVNTLQIRITEAEM
ncbi:ankyrin repeat protein [Cooperia oncophora]